jgi:plastocyanin
LTALSSRHSSESRAKPVILRRWARFFFSLTIVLLIRTALTQRDGEDVSPAQGLPFAFRLASLTPNGFPTGRLHGTVKIESKIQPRSLAINLYSRRGGPPVPAKVTVPPNELENVVLYLEGDFNLAEAHSKRPPEPDEASLTIRQVNETFVPHVLALQTGSTVRFPNGDPFFHNVFSLSGAKSFDLGRYPKNQVRSVRFDRPGIVKIFCHIHSHMNAVILVFDHPYFSVADGKGNFFMNHLPIGSYTLVAWHERLKPQKKFLRIQPGVNPGVDLVL